MFSKEAVEQYVEKKGKTSAFEIENEENPNLCIYCNEKHKLEGCNSFMDKTLKERIKFLAKLRFCSGCLKNQ